MLFPVLFSKLCHGTLAFPIVTKPQIWRHPETAVFKLLLIGDSGTGKSSILLQFTSAQWLSPDQESGATIGVDFKVKMLEVDSKLYKLTIWDTAGQERFRTLTSSYYRGAQGVILVYDVSNRSSFDNLQTWINELETYSSSKDVVKMIVGNKSDKDVSGGREVPRKEGEAFAKRMGTLFIETSAKTTAGVQDAFVEIVRKIVETPSLWQRGQVARPALSLTSGSDAQSYASGCGC
ncbi:ras family-domain-containing protein [Entophlyctis helioformis]|nr:ras family-domain-containing protein [Entophlyctis helioformis]